MAKPTDYKPGMTLFVVFSTGEDVLARCLNSVRPYVDEIVAVDTGARDGARKVAARAGARIFDLAWPGSFAEAYNFAIERVRTEWTFWLDSDEWLLDGEGERLRALTRDPKAAMYRIIRRDFWDDTQYTEMYQTRIWRTHPRLRLQGAIHAQFTRKAMEAGRVIGRLFDTELRIGHDGFKGGIGEEKLRRNLEYIRRELEERPNQSYFEMCLAETLHSLGDPEGLSIANRLVDAAIASPAEPPSNDILSAMFTLAFKEVADEDLNSPRVDAMIRYVWQWFPRNATTLWAVADVEARRENYFEVYYTLREMRDLVESGGFDRLYAFNPEILGKALEENWVVAKAAMGRL